MLFLLILFAIGAGRAADITAFRESDVAAKAFSEAERQHRDRPDLKVVLLAAESVDSIKKTHPHYFNETSDDDPHDALAPAA
jgi:hypothetical protein